MKLEKITNDIFTINNFFSEGECDSYISKTEKIGYEAAKVETEKGAKVIESVRNNNRVILNDPELSSKLWERLEEYVPRTIGNSRVIGLNELFRFYKYQAGQKFKRHIDQSYVRNDVEASYYTFMIYLNQNFEGGETKFNDNNIKAETGKALIFLHSLEHEGAEVKGGTKYVLRTDIMYRLFVGYEAE